MICQSGIAVFVTELYRKKKRLLETRSLICACVRLKPRNTLIIIDRCSIGCGHCR